MFNWTTFARPKSLLTWIGLLTGALCGTALIQRHDQKKEKTSTLKNRQQNEVENIAEVQCKVFTSDEVSAHDSLENGVWVTYQGKVYDITEFIHRHPGGKDKILMSSGGALEPYWSLFPFHKMGSVLDILEEYSIGHLHPEDQGVQEETFYDPYHSDPERHPAFLVLQAKAFIGEVPVDLLMDQYITPNELHYIRNHAPVPAINDKEYRLTLSGKGVTDGITLCLQDLKQKFKKHILVATLQCTGNRRKNSQDVFDGTAGPGLISTAEWGGVLLKDVLEYAGLSDEVIESLGIEHIHFEGLDVDPTDTPYSVSIPITKAMDSRGDVLLAYEMNGEDLPPDHGYPVRVLVPGVVGCRSVKWLGKIIVSEKESDTMWQQIKYKIILPNNDSSLDTAPHWSSPPIQEFPVNSAICYPKDSHSFSRQNQNTIPIKGYACSGGGRSIVRVDVSIDGGKTWKTAALQQQNQPGGRQWAWTFWECEFPIPYGVDSMEVVSKAVDSSYNVQPERDMATGENYLKNSWGRINVVIED